jgi:hypothetical protein
MVRFTSDENLGCLRVGAQLLYVIGHFEEEKGMNTTWCTENGRLACRTRRCPKRDLLAARELR